MISSLRANLHASHDDAEALAVLGRWLVGECGGAAQAVPRLARKLYKLSGQDHFNAVAQSLQMIAKFGSGTLSDKQKDALKAFTKAMRMPCAMSDQQRTLPPLTSPMTKGNLPETLYTKE